jgi:hypothetical protein
LATFLEWPDHDHFPCVNQISQVFEDVISKVFPLIIIERWGPLIFIWETKYDIGAENTLSKCLVDVIYPTCKSIVIYEAGVVKQLF